MAVNIPHYLTFPPVSSLPSNSFRVRKYTNLTTDKSVLSSGNTRRVTLSCPPNWFMLGQQSNVVFTVKTNGRNPDPLPNGGEGGGAGVGIGEGAGVRDSGKCVGRLLGFEFSRSVRP